MILRFAHWMGERELHAAGFTFDPREVTGDEVLALTLRYDIMITHPRDLSTPVLWLDTLGGRFRQR